MSFFRFHQELGVWGIDLPAPFETYWISPLRAGDNKDLMRIFNDERMAPSLYRQPLPYKHEDAQELIDRCQGLEPFFESLQHTVPTPVPRIPDAFWGGLRDGDDKVIGTMDICGRDFDPSGRYIGFFLRCDLTGKGLMGTAARRMIEAIDTHNGPEELSGISGADNPASYGLLSKLGFVETRRWSARYPPDKGGGFREVVQLTRNRR